MVSSKSLINLRRGNPGNSGRPKSAVREAILRVCDDSTGFLADVAAGKQVIVGEQGVKREPTFDERLKAISLAYRYGLGREDKLEAEVDDRDSFPQHTVFKGLDPLELFLGDTFTAEQFAENGKDYISVLCEDGREIRYRLPPGVRPLAVTKPIPPLDCGTGEE